ncbi:hypothetical protein QFC19_006312 [Naganishia cerealis]|uniref:Uncharacterized protein n=1 Tax=Naganishia cerealis TaxID=610337 RepID=A0ACC2VGL6_9TREE|nr:hypothetical protein QFC19_006312 [Naganishia cerealis]
MGGCKVCAWDFRPGATEITPLRQRWTKRCRKIARLANSSRGHRINLGDDIASQREISLAELNLQDPSPVPPDLETAFAPEKAPSQISNSKPPRSQPLDRSIPVHQISRYRSHHEVVLTAQSLQDTIQLAPVTSTSSHSRAIIPGREYDVPENAVPNFRDSREVIDLEGNDSQSAQPPQGSIAKRSPEQDTLQLNSKEVNVVKDRASWYTTPWNILKLTLTPPSISLFLALPISLIQPLKAMFVNVDGWTGGKMPNGPDGKPPLSWLLDVSERLVRSISRLETNPGVLVPK